MSREKPIRLGIIGCGRATQAHHLPAINATGAFRVEAVADIDEEKARRTAHASHAQRWFNSYRELLPLVDAVAVATPTSSHADIAVEALERGLDVLLEKPMAMTLLECDRIAEVAARSRRVLLVAHNARWHRLAARARQIVLSGRLGPIQAIQSLYTHNNPYWRNHWHQRRELGGGVLFNDGVHHFDLWRWLLGAEVLEARCFTADSERFEDDACVVAARLSNGALAAATFSFSTRAASEVEIFGTRAALLLDLYRFDGLRLRQAHELPGSPLVRLKDAMRTLRLLPSGLGQAFNGGGFESTYAAMWRHFARCVRRQTEPLCTAADGRAAVAAALMCRGQAGGEAHVS